MSEGSAQKGKTGYRGRNWCFTLNNYTEGEHAQICGLQSDDGVRYLIMGKEVGESGTAHLQGYIEFQKAKEFGNVKKHLVERVHLEPAKGSSKQNAAYCSKDGDFVEFGTPVGQGCRTDLASVRSQLEAGVGIKQLLAEGMLDSMQKMGFARVVLPYVERKRDWVPTVIWLYGQSGCGKSRLARELVGSDFYRKAPGTGKWFDGYDGEEHVILDDIRTEDYGGIPFMNLLNLLDRYDCRIEMKGGTRQFLGRLIIITAINRHLTVYGAETAEPMKQLTRRITHEVDVEDIDAVQGLLKTLAEPTVEMDSLAPWA